MNLFAQVDREERTASKFPEQVVGFGESWLLKSGSFHGLDPMGLTSPSFNQPLGRTFWETFSILHRRVANPRSQAAVPQVFFWAPRNLGGGTSNMFYFHPYLGKIPILTNIFQMG